MNNLEEYKISAASSSVTYGYFTELVYDKHEESYGLISANNIRKRTTEIFNKLIMQKNNQELSNNTLIIGKIQSGKTSNLEMLTALAFDNGFNLLIIYGGYDNFLLSQSITRFSKTFTNNSSKKPLVISSSTDFDFLTEDYVESKILSGIPIIIEAMKRPSHLDRVNNALSKLKNTNINSFIIDDEGDQASLNTNFHDEKNEPSRTYECIKTMKKLLGNPLYLSVTATPQANIFQPELSQLKPDSLHLLYPGNGYTGADCFHLNDDKIIIVKDTEKDDIIDNNTLPESVKKAINHYLISSTIMRYRGKYKSDMIIHTYREINNHYILARKVQDYIKTIKEAIKVSPDLIDYFVNQIKETFTDKYFDKNIMESVIWDDEFKRNLLIVIKTVYVEQKNSKNGHLPDYLKNLDYIIYIGGDLLQRGITFDNLVTTYFTRWAKKGNMDTSLQRARWFGYRNDIFDLCRVFMTSEIKHEFSNLAAIENDLWEQFTMVEKGELSINDIFIDASKTSLIPTRQNVVDMEKIAFRNKWYNQKFISFDDEEIKYNNSLLDNLLSSLEFKKSSVGRNDGNVSTYYAEINDDSFYNFINDSKYIFDQSPFNKNELLELIKDRIVIIEVMFGGLLKSERHRSFIGNKISALQQGSDTIIKEKQKYMGDAKVLVDSEKINIQIYNIVPFDDNKETLQSEKKQYMFSIHFPLTNIKFIRK